MSSAGDAGGTVAKEMQGRGVEEANDPKVVALGFTLIVLLVVLLLGYSAVGMRDVNQRVDRIVHKHSVSIELVHKMYVAARERSLLLAGIAMELDPFERDEKIMRYYGMASEFAAARQQYAAMQRSGREQAMLAQQAEYVAEIQPLQRQVIELALAEQRMEASRVLVQQAIPAQDRMLSVLNAMMEHEFAESRREAAAAEREAHGTLGFMLAGGLLVAMLSLATGVLVSRRMASLVAKLGTREREARGLLANIPDLVWYKNDAARLVWANHAFEQATALAGSDLAGKTEQDIWQAGSGDCASDDRQALDARGTVSFDRTLATAAGETRQYSLSRTPIYDAGGAYQGMLCVARDTSERELMSRHLKSLLAEIETQQTALDQHAIVSIADLAGNILYVNNKFCEVSGYGREELIGQNHRLLKSGQHPQEFYDDMWITIASGRVWQGEVCNRRKDGGHYWVESTIVPFLDEHGLPQRYVSIRTDITPLKDLEQAMHTANEELGQRVNERTAELSAAKTELEADIAERKRSQAELEGAYRHLEEAQSHLLQSEKLASIGQLAAGVAHEINNPIGYVYSNLGSLEQYLKELFEVLAAYESGVTDPPVVVREVTQRIDVGFLKEDIPALMGESREGITRVKKIVQDLKDFSHVHASDEWQFADLHKGLDSTLNIVNNEIKYKADVKKEYGDLPEVECLASQLNQVFMNLLVNAAHAIDERGTIAIRSGTAEDQVWVEIADTGKGIAAENLKRIFDPFFTTKPIGKGTGLGLSLSYGIIQKHRGRIEVESEVGKGTTFRVWLPVKQPEAEAAEA